MPKARNRITTFITDGPRPRVWVLDHTQGGTVRIVEAYFLGWECVHEGEYSGTLWPLTYPQADYGGSAVALQLPDGSIEVQGYVEDGVRFAAIEAAVDAFDKAVRAHHREHHPEHLLAQQPVQH